MVEIKLVSVWVHLENTLTVLRLPRLIQYQKFEVPGNGRVSIPNLLKSICQVEWLCIWCKSVRVCTWLICHMTS